MNRRPVSIDRFFDTIQSFDIDGLELHRSCECVAHTESHAPPPPNFPRPEDHFIIADYIVDLPIISTDFSDEHGSHGRVISYCYGEYWICADNIPDFIASIKHEGEGAFYGKGNYPEQSR